MLLSVIMYYRCVDAIAYLYSVENPTGYIQNQGLEVLKSVTGKFPFKSSPTVKEPCIMSSGKAIGIAMKELMQARCDVVGVEILGMEIMSVQFSAEMAESLLLSQQA